MGAKTGCLRTTRRRSGRGAWRDAGKAFPARQSVGVSLYEPYREVVHARQTSPTRGGCFSGGVLEVLGAGNMKIDVRLTPDFVRYTPNNGHSRQARQCPLIANNSRSAKADIAIAHTIGTAYWPIAGPFDSHHAYARPAPMTTMFAVPRSSTTGLSSASPNSRP